MLQKYSNLDIIKAVTECKDESLMLHFLEMLSHLYQYNCLKPLMDLTATKCLQQVLRFKVQDRKFFELDEGNCKTIEEVSVNNFLNNFKTHKKYIITIKKLEYDVIIHEIAHMLEKEVELPLDVFSEVLLNNINSANISNVTLKSTIQRVLFEEVGHYKESHRKSELFARYFQIIAMSKDISGFSAVTGYDVKTILYYLDDTQKWLQNIVYNLLNQKVDRSISENSDHYIKDIEEVKHMWSEQKVRSIHHPKKAWNKTIKSIKEK